MESAERRHAPTYFHTVLNRFQEETAPYRTSNKSCIFPYVVPNP